MFKRSLGESKVQPGQNQCTSPVSFPLGPLLGTGKQNDFSEATGKVDDKAGVEPRLPPPCPAPSPHTLPLGLPGSSGSSLVFPFVPSQKIVVGCFLLICLRQD